MGTNDDRGLLRALGPFTATALVAGTVIGSGIFVKPKSIAENVPGFDMVAVVWVLGGLLALLGGAVTRRGSGVVSACGRQLRLFA